LIDIRDLRKNFRSGTETLHILTGIDLQVGKGEMVQLAMFNQ